MKTPRFYLDTSVIGGCFDAEFSAASGRLFDRCREGQGIIMVSEIVMEELIDAPPCVRELVTGADPYPIETVAETRDSIELADAYLAAGIVGPNFRDDCRHVALATVARVDVLVSWNFRHIVRFDRIRAFNSVNMLKGYSLLDIRSPLEVFPE